MGKISVIDGTSNAGKTTICENLKGRAKNVFIIPEARLFIEMYNIRKLNIPSIPKNAEEEKENQKFFFELELNKLIEANRLAKQGKNVCIDSGILEILSVSYSFESINKWKGIYKNAKELYQEFIQETHKLSIRLPDEYVWLQADFNEILRRNKLRELQRGRALSETDWIEARLINKQIEFFEKISCIPRNDGKIHIVNTNEMSKQEVLETVCGLLNLKLKETEREIYND